MLFAPGNRPGRMSVALASGADAVVLDLEDSVPHQERERARANVAQCLSEVPDGVECWVRVVAAHVPGFGLDLDAAVRPGLTGLVLPGVDSPAAVAAADKVIGDIERRRGLPARSVALLPLAESALGVRNLYDALTASSRVTATAFPGAVDADLCTDLGAQPTPGGNELLYARSKVLLDARAAGLDCILDSVWTDLDDAEGLRRDSRSGRRIGYTGRLAIHPAQIPVLHEVFTPSALELADARELLSAYEQAQDRGEGALRYRGRLVDRAMAERAERLLGATRSPGARS
jgi:citrate lyase subunit beta/citryl-CoA lyase